MNFNLIVALLFTALFTVGISAGYVYYNPTVSPDNWIWGGQSPTNWSDGGVHAAPGPIAGVGLPFAAGSYLAYWLIKRRRKDGRKDG